MSLSISLAFILISSGLDSMTSFGMSLQSSPGGAAGVGSEDVILTSASVSERRGVEDVGSEVMVEVDGR